MLIEYLGRTAVVSRDAASQRKTGSNTGRKKKSYKYELADGDHKICVSRGTEDVFQENTIFQVHYFLSFESTCLRCMLLSDKGGRHLLVLTENPNQDLPSFINFL